MRVISQMLLPLLVICLASATILSCGNEYKEAQIEARIEREVQNRMQAELDRILAGRARDGRDSPVIIAYWLLYKELDPRKSTMIIRDNEGYKIRAQIREKHLEKRLEILKRIENVYGVSLNGLEHKE